jgi:hypothetical protein
MWRKTITTLMLIAVVVPMPSQVRADPDDSLGTSAIAPDGSAVLGGRPGAFDLCNPSDGAREISVVWLDRTGGVASPLHIHMTGAGYLYTNYYPFEYWTGQYPSWDWSQPDTGLSGRDNLDGAMNLMLRFECMSQPTYDVRDIAANPLDVNYVYELLCTTLHVGTDDHDALAEIDRSHIDCSRVGLSGLSGGGLTSSLFLNECFEELTITPYIRAIATMVSGFFPLTIGDGGYCPADPTSNRYNYRFDRSVPLFMKVACSDELIPFSTFVEDQWQSSPPPKYLYSRSGIHAPGSPQGLIFGGDLIQAFMRYYLLGDTGPTGRGALDDYPDRQNLRPTDFVSTSYQYQSEIGVNLSGGLCRESFNPWISPEWDIDSGYLDHLRSRTESLSEEVTDLPDTL